jgi:hypothetical protein
MFSFLLAMFDYNVSPPWVHRGSKRGSAGVQGLFDIGQRWAWPHHV